MLVGSLLPMNLESSCLCKNKTETFLPYAKHSKKGIVALVKVIEQKIFDLAPSTETPFIDPVPINYFEVEVLHNFGSTIITDTINILIPSEVEDCLVYPNIGMKGDSAFIYAYEWDEPDYGYVKNEFKAYCFSNCMISSLLVKNGFAIGAITKKKEQKMAVKDLIHRL